MNINLPYKKEKPWGYEIIYAVTDKYAAKIIFIKEGHRLSLQYHKTKEETMYLYSGRATIEKGNSTTDLEVNIFEPGHQFHLPPGTCHRLCAIEDTVILEVSTPELDDVVRLEDDYGRQKR